MSWRLSVFALAAFVIGCSDGISPAAHPTSLSKSAAALPVDTSFHIRVLPNLDGNKIFVSAFNQYDVVTGVDRSGSTSRIFRSRTTIEYLTPPAGYQQGNFLGPVAGINASGKVVGGIISDTAQRALIWWHNGGTTLLLPTYPFIQPQGPTGCAADAINDTGSIVGICNSGGNVFAAVWQPDGTNRKVWCCGELTAISGNGHLTGYDTRMVIPRTIVWRLNDTTDYDIIGSDSSGHPLYSMGLAVNDSGWVAGWGFVTDLLNHTDSSAVLWLPGHPFRVLSHIGVATGVDDRGNVVGYHRDTATGPTTAFLWNVATGAHFLPGLPGGTQTAAVAISNVNREILGWAVDSHGLKHAVIWRF